MNIYLSCFYHESCNVITTPIIILKTTLPVPSFLNCYQHKMNIKKYFCLFTTKILLFNAFNICKYYINDFRIDKVVIFSQILSTIRKIHFCKALLSLQYPFYQNRTRVWFPNTFKLRRMKPMLKISELRVRHVKGCY